jgi:hypothetical protein
MSDMIFPAFTTAFSPFIPVDSKAHNTSEAFTLLAERLPPDWWPAVEDRIESLRRLGPNWDSYGAERPKEASILAALQILNCLSRIVGVECPETGVTPTGNVTLSWELNDGEGFLDLEILDTFQLNYCHCDQHDEIIERGLTGDLRFGNELMALANALTQW